MDPRLRGGDGVSEVATASITGLASPEIAGAISTSPQGRGDWAGEVVVMVGMSLLFRSFRRKPDQFAWSELTHLPERSSGEA